MEICKGWCVENHRFSNVPGWGEEWVSRDVLEEC